MPRAKDAELSVFTLVVNKPVLALERLLDAHHTLGIFGWCKPKQSDVGRRQKNISSQKQNKKNFHKVSSCRSDNSQPVINVK